MERMERKEDNEDFIDGIEEITLPFRYHLMNEILEMAEDKSIKSSLRYTV